MTHLTPSQFNEYLDGTLPDSMRALAGEHLRTCEACRSELGELQSLFAALAHLPEARLARDMSPQVLSRLPQGRSARTPASAVQLGAAAGVLGFLLVRLAESIGVPPAPAVDLGSILSFGAAWSLAQPPSLHSQILDFFAPLYSLHLPDLTSFVPRSSAGEMWLILLGTLALALFGNALLLRDRAANTR